MSKLRSTQGLVAFITGAASGLGRGTAEYLIKHGAKVAIADLPSSAGGSVAEELGTDNASFVPMDIVSPDDVSKALRSSVDRFGRIGAVINCAGQGQSRTIYNITESRPSKLEDFDQLMKVNVTGTFNVMRLSVEYLMNNEPDSDGNRGVIVNTAGFAAFDGQQAQAAYAATGGAIISMTLPAARDLASLGIRVVTISPGLFDTPLLSYLPEKVRKYLADQSPSPPRFGQPPEFGHLVRYILENPYLNGENIRLDAGTRLWM